MYNSGTWTPTFEFHPNARTLANVSKSGNWIQTGQQVTCYFDYHFDYANGGVTTGWLAGFPFLCNAATTWASSTLTHCVLDGLTEPLTMDMTGTAGTIPGISSFFSGTNAALGAYNSGTYTQWAPLLLGGTGQVVRGQITFRI